MPDHELSNFVRRSFNLLHPLLYKWKTLLDPIATSIHPMSTEEMSLVVLKQAGMIKLSSHLTSICLLRQGIAPSFYYSLTVGVGHMVGEILKCTSAVVMYISFDID